MTSTKFFAETLRKQNPKSEYRNPKRTPIQIDLKSGKSKTPDPNETCLEFYLFWSFEIVSNFGFRASNLQFVTTLTLNGLHHSPAGHRPLLDGVEDQTLKSESNNADNRKTSHHDVGIEKLLGVENHPA